MMSGYTLLRESWPVARKNHRCIWCGEAITSGTLYRHEKSVYDFQFQNHHWHDECNDAFAEEMSYEGSPMEFSPYENERPVARDDARRPASPLATAPASLATDLPS